jgi:hypothetical protein
MTGHGHGAEPEGGGHKGVALLIAVLALFLALAETGAKGSQTEALARNVESANLWAFFQARTIRQTTVRTAAEQATLELATAPEGQRAIIQRQIEAWQNTATRWESEPETGEGRREWMARAKAAERSRLKGSCAGKSGFRMPVPTCQRSSTCACSVASVQGASPFGPRQSARTVEGAAGGQEALSS